MVIVMIGLILALVACISLLVFGKESKPPNSKFIFHKGIIISVIFIFVIAVGFIMLGIENYTTERIYKRYLKKGNPYEMVIKYELKDSIYYSTDTVYILKAKH